MSGDCILFIQTQKVTKYGNEQLVLSKALFENKKYALITHNKLIPSQKDLWLWQTIIIVLYKVYDDDYSLNQQWIIFLMYKSFIL